MPEGRNGLDATGTGAAGDPIVQISSLAELALHGAAPEEIAVERQHANHRAVGGKARPARTSSSE